MSAEQIREQSHQELQRIRDSHNRFADLRSSNRLEVSDLEFAAEGFLVRVMSLFEAALRDLLVECVAGSADLPGVHSYIEARSPRHATDVIFGETDRLKWIPVAESLDRADRLLKFGQPFVRLRLRHLELIDQGRIVRNRIAHDGEEALRLYEKRVQKGDRSFDRPGRWLLHRQAGTRLDNLGKIIASIEACIGAICTPEPDLDTTLGRPSHVSTDSAAPAGTYTCNECTEQHRHGAHGRPIGHCPACKRSGGQWILAVLENA